MKTILTVSLAALILLVGTSECVSASPQNNDAIKSIQRQYAAINKRAARYRKIKKQLSGFSLEGGELVAYFDGPAIVKLVANHYGEGGRSVEEYYFLKDKLIFVYQKDSRYDRPMSGRVVRTAESRYYFDNDQLVRWIDENSKQASQGTEEFQSKQKEFLESAITFAKGARSKSRTIEAPN